MISKDDVRYVAHLSRIHLQDNEVDHLAQDLEKILDYIEKLKEPDITDVKPTSHVLPLKNVFREDTVRPSLKQEDVQKLAVSFKDGSFKVPLVIE